MSDHVEVSRRIGTDAAAIWKILTDPARHLELDGSGMLRGAVTTTPVIGATRTATCPTPAAGITAGGTA